MSGIRDALERRFAAQRVVFWHDPSRDYSADVDALALDDVTTIRVANDAYAVKHTLLHVEPTSKFLVYRSAPVPDGLGNWLPELTRTLLIENSTGADAKYASLVEYGLDGFYWQGTESIYGNSSANLSIDDFVLWLCRQAM